jgi:hypothetical protein
MDYVPEGMIMVGRLSTSVQESLSRQLDAITSQIKAWKGRAAQTAKAHKAIALEALKPVLPIVKCITKKYGGVKGSELAHDGTSIYSEPTFDGLLDIAIKLRPLLGDPSRHVLLDCGSGVGTALFALCNTLGIKGIGIEYSPNRIFMGCRNICAVLSKFKDDKVLQHRVAYMYGNLLDLHSLPSCVTIAYQFDEAFPPDVMMRLMALYASAPPSLRFIICSKAFKQPSYGSMFASHGLYPLTGAIVCTKIGTLTRETSAFVIYGRRCCDYSDLDGKVFLPPGPHNQVLETKPNWRAVSLPPNVAAVLDGNVAAANQYHLDLMAQMAAIMSTKRTHNARVVSCCPGPDLNQHCQEGTCETCKTGFAHVDVATLYADVPVWLPGQKGLFTKNPLPSRQFVIKYVGRVTKAAATGAYVLRLAPNHYVDARGYGLHQFINHSCNPNCKLEQWTDAMGIERVSIVTQHTIDANEELTTDYGADRETFHCQCPACSYHPIASETLRTKKVTARKGSNARGARVASIPRETSHTRKVTARKKTNRGNTLRCTVRGGNT